MDKIVFLCTGNTCRSPMAEGFFRQLGGEEKTKLQAASAGLFTADGLPVSENAVVAAAELGADIRAHRSQMLTAALAEEARYLVCMTRAHYDRVLEMFPQVEDKLFTLSSTDISDPFGGNLDTYRQCARQLYQAVASVIERLKNDGNCNDV